MTELTDSGSAFDQDLEAEPAAADVAAGLAGLPRAPTGAGRSLLGGRALLQRHSRVGLLLYVLYRLVLLIPGALVVASATFFLVNAVPSDPIGAQLGDFASPEQIAQLKHKLGLDQDLWHRYLSFLSHLLHGSLGNSYKTGAPVLSGMGHVICSSLVLVVPGFILGAVLGVFIGGWQARSHHPGGIRLLITAFQAMPTFVSSVFAILLFVSTVKLFPAPSGQYPVDVAAPPYRTGAAIVDNVLAGRWGAAGSCVPYLILPVLVLGLALMVPFARITASTIRSNMDADFTVFTRANGIRRRFVNRNARRAARTSIITTSGIVAAELMGGTVIVERIFSWNGLGSYALNSVIDKDLPAIQGFVILVTVATMVTFVVSDILGTLLDPRLR